MLAAAPDRNSALGLLQVVLSSVTRQPDVDISDGLKIHIVGVFKSASAILANPSSIDRDTPAEALELALRIRGQAELSTQVSQIGAFENINSDVAEEILRTLRSLRPHAA